MTRRSDKAFTSFAKKVLRRDNHTCQYCGYRAKYFQEIINKDGNYRNNRLSNMVTACPFCAQCGFLHIVGISDFGGGILVYLPELSQQQLNASCHSLFCMLANNAYQSSESKALYRDFKLRSQQVEQTLGEGLYKPEILGKMMIEKSDVLEKLRQTEFWKGLRLLPLLQSYIQQIKILSMDAQKEFFNIAS